MSKHFGVAGSPISQSLSPNLHLAAFKFLDRDADYSRFEVSSDLVGFLSQQRPPLDGLSVTMPLKEEALQLAEHVDALATRTRACNTLVLGRHGWSGFNTDVLGLQKALSGTTAGSVLIIGSGATSRSALATAQLRGDEITCWARSTIDFSDEQTARFAESAPDRMDSFDLVVSTIPLQPFLTLLAKSTGMPKQIFSAAYSPSMLTTDALSPDVNWIDGREMLLWQAVAQQALFANLEAEAYLDNHGLVAAMRAALERPVGE
jgi:shikimate dehydrogenase